MKRPDATIEQDLQLLEKLYDLGDSEGARMIARRLLLAHKLSDDDKRRIKRVIDGTKPGFLTRGNIIFIVVLLVLFYLYLQYEA